MFERYLGTEVAGMPTIATEQEVNLAVDVGGRPILVRGFIDRLCEDAEGRAWVVDYKTNRSLGAEALTVYGRQLAIYKRATREALGLDAGAMLMEMRTGAGAPRWRRQLARSRSAADNAGECGAERRRPIRPVGGAPTGARARRQRGEGRLEGRAKC